MSKVIRNIIVGTLAVALIAVVFVTVGLPFTQALAAGANDLLTQTALSVPDPTIQTAWLNLIFPRQKMTVSMIGMAETNYDNMTKNMQIILDNAKASGKDVSSIQTAFDAYKTAFLLAKSSYDQANSIVTTHDGFDANGQVTDITKAKATVKNLRDSLKQYRDTIGQTRKTLRDAVQAFRKANPRSIQIPGQS
jgi:hypothetical protein